VPHASTLDARALQKSALRACTDDLVVSGGFKFRRSAFKGYEPKVTLVAPASMGFHTENIPVSFSVNTVTPFYSVALMTECGQIDPRAKDLILLVRKWAKDRGISHASKGHLSPYLWTLVVIYFLQVHERDGSVSLPALSAFKLSSGLLQNSQAPSRKKESPASEKSNVATTMLSSAVLFQEFVSFYTSSFNWQNEVVSVRSGVRGAPSLSFRFHVVVDGSGATDCAPCIEDPFDPRQNMSSHMTAVTIERMRDEFQRANVLLEQQASLSELLEPWTPEQGPSPDGDCDADQ